MGKIIVCVQRILFYRCGGSIIIYRFVFVVICRLTGWLICVYDLAGKATCIYLSWRRTSISTTITSTRGSRVALDQQPASSHIHSSTTPSLPLGHIFLAIFTPVCDCHMSVNARTLLLSFFLWSSHFIASYIQAYVSCLVWQTFFPLTFLLFFEKVART